MSDDPWEKQMIPVLPELIKALKPSRLAPYLLSNKLISKSEYHEINSRRPEEKAAEYLLLDVLATRLPKQQTFDKFCYVLGEVEEQKGILTLLASSSQLGIEAEERRQTAVPEKAEEAEQKKKSSNGVESLSGIPTTQQLLELSKHLVGNSKWKYIARRLEFEELMIEVISEDNKGDSREQAYQMLLRWKVAQSRSASIRKLCKALVEEDQTKTATEVFGISDELLKSL